MASHTFQKNITPDFDVIKSSSNVYHLSSSLDLVRSGARRVKITLIQTRVYQISSTFLISSKKSGNNCRANSYLAALVNAILVRPKTRTVKTTRVRFPAGGPWSCIFRSWSQFGSYNVYLNDTRISNT